MKTIQSQYLVLGATGSIGFAFTEELLTHQVPVTILVRNKAKAQRLFPQAPHLEIVEGDAHDATLLKQIAGDKKYIFHGINYPYDQWKSNMEPVTRHVIEAAAINQATIIFPGNVYSYGDTPFITENTHPNPVARKGQIRMQLEAMLQKAAEGGKCQVLNVRLPDFWGPNVTNAGIAPIFTNALNRKAMPWALRTDIPHQLVYTRDAARLIFQLAQQDRRTPYELYNYGGQTFTSIREWFSIIAEEAKAPLKIRVYPKWLLILLGLFMPGLRELKEMLYLFEKSIILDDSRVRKLVPQFRETPIKQAVAETLSWFKTHYVST